MIKIIAHRANDKHKYGENKYIGVVECLNTDYIAGVEIDVRMTKDNYFVLNHNMTFNNHIIENRKYKDLKLDKLSEILKIKTNKIILLDLKCENLDYKKYGDELLKVLKKRKNIYLCSFNYSLAHYLKQKTKYKVGIFVSSLINKNKDYKPFDFIAFSYKEYRKIGKKTFIWTVNKEEIFNKFKKLDIYIITDKAYKLIKNC